MYIVLISYMFVFILAEFAYRYGVSADVSRKIVHIGAGCVTALLPLYFPLWMVVLFGVGMSVIMFVTKRNKLLQSIHGITREDVGALLFAPSLILIALATWHIDPIIFQVSALVLGISDGLAGLIGQRYGKPSEWWFVGKSILGSSVVFFSTALIILIVFQEGAIEVQGITIALIGGCVIMLAEALGRKGWDNATVPFSTAVLCTITLI